MNKKLLIAFISLTIIQSYSISKQIPGSEGGILSVKSNGKYLVHDYSDFFTIYDIEADSLVNSIGGERPMYAVTNEHNNYYEDGSLNKVDLITGEEILSFPVSTETNNESFRSLDFYKGNRFIYNSSKSYYIVEDTKSGYEFTHLFEIADDFMFGNNKGVYYNDGQIIYIDDDGYPKSFSHEFENGVRVFAYKDGYVIYNIVENGTDYIASYNTVAKTKRRVENDEAYRLKIIGNKVVTYKNIFWNSLSIMSFDLFEYSVFQISDKFGINYLTPIDDRRIVATSEAISTSYLLDLDEESIKPINRISSNIETFTFSKDSKYIGVINYSLVPKLGNKLFKVIELETNDIVYEYYYSTENFIEEIFYNEEYGFVFQSGDYELSSFLANQDSEVKSIIKTEKEITSHNINDDYLFVGHNNRFDFYDLKNMGNVFSKQTNGNIDLIRYNSKHIIFNSMISINNYGRASTLFRLNLQNFDLDSINLNNHINLKLGQETAPLFGINEKYLYKINDYDEIWFLKIDQEALGENRVLNGEEFGAIVAINDSVFICSARDEPYFIKKVKFNYDDITYEVIEDYPINISEITYPSGNTSETDISRLVVNDKYIAYANYKENTIRIIEDKDLVTRVETYETVDYFEFLEMLESGRYEINVYDMNGRVIGEDIISLDEINRLKNNTPFLVSISNKKINKIYKLIK